MRRRAILAAFPALMAWPDPSTPVLICGYTQGGSPDDTHLATIFADIGRMVGQQLG